MANTHFMTYILLLLTMSVVICFQCSTRSMLRYSYIRMTSTSARVILEKGKARLFQDGNPLIYGGAVKAIEGDAVMGSYVRVEDHMGNSIGKGMFNPLSTYRVRLFTRSFEREYDLEFPDVIASRIRQAILVRKSLLLPSKITTAYRLINGEGDRLSGLMVDVLGNVVVIQSSAVWIENYKADIQTALRRELRESGLQIDSYVFLWRQSDQRLKQDGYDFPINESDQPETEMIDSNSINQEIIENSVKFLFDPNDGQKTGFYCDQRDNRLLLRSLSLGKDILDTYCYVGGFSINAALGGASRVVAVDSSQQAIDYGIKNARLNGVENKIQYIKMDAIKLMENELAVGNKYDIVVCDPPKLAPTRSSLIKAKNKYVRINSIAMSLVKPGGLLLTFSCSAAVAQTPGTFLNIISEAGKKARRDITVLTSRGAASDHPFNIAYPDGQYLSALLCSVA